LQQNRKEEGDGLLRCSKTKTKGDDNFVAIALFVVAKQKIRRR
jgi:hypothetical protein